MPLDVDVGGTVQKYPQDILDHLMEGCQIISPGWRYVYVNQAVAQQGRKTKRQLLGQTMMHIYPGIEATEMFHNLRHCMEKRLPASMENEFRFPSGAKGWFELRMEPVPEGVLIFSIDITQRKRVEERAKELDALKTEFITIVSHQLRTPLTSIHWNLEELLGSKMGRLSELQQELLRFTYDANNEIIARIDDLLTAVEIEEGRVQLKTETAQPESLLRSVVQGFEDAFAVKSLHHKLSSPARRLPLVTMDLMRIRQVLSKLIDNAITYTKDKGSVNITVTRKGKAVRFEVKDTGIGIPAAEQDGIFRRFVRGSNASAMKPDASGLGLFLAKHFVGAHGGKIGFSSKEFSGSTFWFELPITK